LHFCAKIPITTFDDGFWDFDIFDFPSTLVQDALLFVFAKQQLFVLFLEFSVGVETDLAVDITRDSASLACSAIFSFGKQQQCFLQCSSVWQPQGRSLHRNAE
jgi:hypothetical protein